METYQFARPFSAGRSFALKVSMPWSIFNEHGHWGFATGRGGSFPPVSMYRERLNQVVKRKILANHLLPSSTRTRGWGIHGLGVLGGTNRVLLLAVQFLTADSPREKEGV